MIEKKETSMSKIQEIMTKNPICLSEHANVHKARMLMAEKSIRHIPVKNSETNQMVGMLSQKALLANAIKIINKRGINQLEHEEKSTEVSSIMDNNPAVFNIESNLLDVANSLLEKKNGCVAITQDDNLVGVITSNDFVKLTVRELGPSTC